jgi:peptide/nickel transport system substrate-binding protein
VDASVVAAILPRRLRESNGAMAEGVTARSLSPTVVDLAVPYPSRFWIEALEEPIRKPGSATIATGPFALGASPTELWATDDYYLGRPVIDKIQINPFPSVRSAWAELLRNNIDMLYEVGPEALDSLESSTGISVFTFIRSYQLTVTLNTASPPLRSPTVRQALNLAIDRTAIVNRALNGHGVAANGPLRSNHWTGLGDRGFPFDPQRATAMLKGHHVAFTCLLPIDPMYERLGLELQRQLAAIGVEMRLQSLPPDEMFAAGRARNYEAMIFDSISGPTLLRLYLLWHSAGTLNTIGRGSPRVDAALDEARRATTDEEYRHAATDVQQAFIDDPPAILLAWGERARAVSKRFVVPPPSADRPDILATLRLWTSRNDQRVASRN